MEIMGHNKEDVERSRWAHSHHRHTKQPPLYSRFPPHPRPPFQGSTLTHGAPDIRATHNTSRGCLLHARTRLLRPENQRIQEGKTLSRIKLRPTKTDNKTHDTDHGGGWKRGSRWWQQQQQRGSSGSGETRPTAGVVQAPRGGKGHRTAPRRGGSLRHVG